MNLSGVDIYSRVNFSSADRDARVDLYGVDCSDTRANLSGVDRDARANLSGGNKKEDFFLKGV